MKWNKDTLKEMRQKYGYSLERVSEITNIPPRTLSRLENGHSQFKQEYCDKLSKLSISQIIPKIEKHLSNHEVTHAASFSENISEKDETMAALAKEGLEKENFKKIAKETESYLKKFIKKLPNSAKINIWSLFKYSMDSKIPIHSKALAVGALLYFITPIDAIPDAIPFVGFLEDIGIIGLALASYMKDQTFKKLVKKAEKELQEKGYLKE